MAEKDAENGTITLGSGVSKLLGLGFGLWATLLPLTAYWFIGEIKDLDRAISPGILPVAVAEITELKRQIIASGERSAERDSAGARGDP